MTGEVKVPVETSSNGSPFKHSKIASDYEAWKCICIAHGIRSFATRSWKFFLPLFLSQSCGSLRATAAMSLAKNLAVAMLSTSAANAYHSTSNSFVKAVLMENVAVVAGGILLSIYGYGSTESTCNAPFSSLIFCIAVACACIDAVSTSLLTTVISKEWVAQLSSGTGYSLASANARLSQIDLICAAACPILVSAIIEQGGYKTVLFLLVGQHAIGAFLILQNVARAMTLKPHLAVVAPDLKLAEQQKLAQRQNMDPPKTQSSLLANPFNIFLDDVVPLKAKMATAAFVLLYFTVLSPGAVMTAWLNSSDIHPRTIATFSFACNLMGAMATLLAPPLISRLGNYRASVVAQFFQCACIVVATTLFYQYGRATTGFLMAVVASRVGLFVFDLCERQILQESVPRSRQTLFFNTERGLKELALFGMMYLSYIYFDSFGVLVNFSAAAVTASSMMLGLAMFL